MARIIAQVSTSDTRGANRSHRGVPVVLRALCYPEACASFCPRKPLYVFNFKGHRKL
ncbi:hypothetical protein BDZ89DRAFT_1061480 [Hymenopellis radicata]|nr:hypothetical protein BDZ89DRAFT_1061480 [Hymenopellis radicata]